MAVIYNPSKVHNCDLHPLKGAFCSPEKEFGVKYIILHLVTPVTPEIDVIYAKLMMYSARSMTKFGVFYTKRCKLQLNLARITARLCP